jgi:hypothetical protein
VQPLVRRVFEPFLRRFAAILVFDEAIATPRSGHFIQNSSKVYYLLPLLVLVLVAVLVLVLILVFKRPVRFPVMLTTGVLVIVADRASGMV